MAARRCLSCCCCIPEVFDDSEEYEYFSEIDPADQPGTPDQPAIELKTIEDHGPVEPRTIENHGPMEPRTRENRVQIELRSRINRCRSKPISGHMDDGERLETEQEIAGQTRVAEPDDDRIWRDEDLCDQHRRAVYCRRMSMSMTNLFNPSQVDHEEEMPQIMSAVQKRCTYPPSRTKRGLQMLGHNILQHYRRLHSDSSDSSSSKDSLSGASSGETSSMSISVIPDPETEVSREPEVKQDMTTDHMVDRNCHANGSYAYINGTLPEEELTRTKRHCPLCIMELKEDFNAKST